MDRSVTPRSPFTALKGERLAGIGHNQGPPLDAAVSWRKHVWKKARKELLPKLPLEIIRRRVKRAQDLGLDYPAYASILLGTGRDIVGFLYTCDALGLRLARTAQLPDPVATKLQAVDCDRVLGAEARDNPSALAKALTARHAITFRATATLPDDPNAPWTQGRAAIRAALDPIKIPSDAVVMIGAHPHERAWADAARLAKFLPAETYFP